MVIAERQQERLCEPDVARRWEFRMAEGSTQAESPTDETGKRSAIVSAQGIPTAGVVCVLSGSVLLRVMASAVQASRLGA
jgi:hypothetical protein